MAIGIHKVQLTKLESTALGGSDSDIGPYSSDQPIDSQEDAIEIAGIYFNDETDRDDAVQAFRDAGELWMKDTIVTTAISLQRITAISEVAKEPTGIEPTERLHSTLSVDDGTRTFTIEPDSPTYTEFSFYIKGQKFTKTTAQDVVFPDTEGTHYFYFNSGGTLVTTMSDDDWINALLGDGALIGIIYWDADNNTAIFIGDERHGLMPGPTHLHFHLAFGAQWYLGGALTDFVTDGSGDLDTHAQMGVADLEMADEDIRYSYSDGSPQDFAAPAQIPCYYRSGATGNWRKKTADNFPLIYSGTAGYTGANGRAPYNEWTGSTWQLTEVSSNDFFIMIYFGTNDIAEPVIGIQGQAEYGSLGDARTGVETELANLVTGGLDTPEFIPLGAVICQTGNGYSNTPKTRFREIETGGPDYYDLRFNERFGGGGGGVTDHGNLTGLLDDDHTQYQIVDQRLTSEGDICYHDGSGVNRFAIGANGKVLGSNGTTLEWVDQTGGGGTALTEIVELNQGVASGGLQIQLSLGVARAMAFIPSMDMTVDQLAFYVTTAGSGATIDVALYDDNYDALANATLAPGTSTGLVVSTTFTDVDLTAGTRYWIGMSIQSGTSPYFQYTSSNTADQVNQHKSVISPFDLPDPWSGSSSGFAITCGVKGTATVVAGTIANGVAKYFDAYDTTGGTNITSGAAVPLDTERVKDTGFTHSTVTNNSEVTIDDAGRYLVLGRWGTEIGSGSQRSESEGWLELDTGSGFSEVDGTRAVMYNREANEGGTHGSCSLVLDLDTGDKLRMFAQRISGSNSNIQLANDNSGMVIIQIPNASNSIQIANNGTNVASRPAINFKPGPGVELDITDDAVNERVDVMITSGGGIFETFPQGLINISNINVNQNNWTWGGLISPSVDISIGELECWCSQTASGNVQGAIWNASTGAKLSNTTTTSVSIGKLTMSFATAQDLTAGQDYYIGFVCTANGSRFVGSSTPSSSFNPNPKPSWNTGSSLPATLSPGQSGDLVWMRAIGAS